MMCGLCGCGADAVDRHDHHHGPGAADGPRHPHAHGSGPSHHHQPPLGAVHAPGVDRARVVRIEADILGENHRFADANRRWFTAHGILALNLMSGPGAGKTTLLVRTIEDLADTMSIAVLEGDQQTSFDAERIRATGVPALQINTGKGCHLDAHMVAHAVAELTPSPRSLLFVENVGNLVCPAGFDLGEAARVVLLSVTEGDDKPLKYPDMFHAADILVLTKVDLLPHVRFDPARCLEFARRLKPGIDMLPLSATTGEGMTAWYDWVRARYAASTGLAARAGMP